jgi:hypothetical protein
MSQVPSRLALAASLVLLSCLPIAAQKPAVTLEGLLSARRRARSPNEEPVDSPAPLCGEDTGAPKCREALAFLVASSIRPDKIRINLFIIRACCIAKVNLSEMAFEAFPRCLFLCIGRLSSVFHARSCRGRVGCMRLLGRAASRPSSQRFNERWLSPEGRPARRPSTLMSSSRSGQWMPTPLPIRRHRLRSWRVPWTRRGYHASGTTTVRPSARSTASLSAVTLT